jgi:hypothetical protein
MLGVTAPNPAGSGLDNVLYLFQLGYELGAATPMDDRRWRMTQGRPLNAPGDLLGISFGPDGPSIGPVPLLRKIDGAVAVRPVGELEYVLGLAFDESIGIAQYLPALAGIARALNEGDPAQAMLRTHLINLPILPGPDAYRRAIEAEDMLKASPNDPAHPGYPKGAPDDRGGQFRPKNDLTDETTQISEQLEHGAVRQAERRIIRRAVRAALSGMFKRRAALLLAEAASNAIPVVGEVDDVIAAGQILDMAGQSVKIYKEADVALDFYRGGPHELDQLFVGKENEGFDTFEAFKKLDAFSQEDMEKRFGAAGDGYEYHHIVEQGQGGVKLSARELNSTRNIVRIPKLLHEEITSEYATKFDRGPMGGALRSRVRDLTYEQQRRFGVEAMRRLGIIK